MAKIIVNNVELEYDLLELENAEKYEAALKRVTETASRITVNDSLSYAIKTQCTAVFDFIDTLFGEGMHKEVFGSSVNLEQCLRVFRQIVEGMSSDKQKLEGLMPNRSARRKNAKK